MKDKFSTTFVVTCFSTPYLKSLFGYCAVSHQMRGRHIRCRCTIVWGTVLFLLFIFHRRWVRWRLWALHEMETFKPQQLPRFIITVLGVLFLKGERFIGPLQKIKCKGNASFSLCSSEIFFRIGKSFFILTSSIECFTSHLMVTLYLWK